MTAKAVRIRFAPSPTGHLHVGGARTALFNWLFARRYGGVFVLRIEDSDRQRSSEAMTGAILDGLRWLGLGWDEGPYYQADRFEQHRADASRLLDLGAGYRCFCSTAELEGRRASSGGVKDEFRYDRHCLTQLSAAQAAARAEAGEPHVIRFLVPDGETAWSDAVCGRIRFDNADIEDFVVLRSDGTPVYNLAVVSDDADMGITHVIRGDDHISNTPKQILLYQALGLPLPTFAHIPMILGPDGKRLSKRHGASAVAEYAEQGIVPWALVNFLALLGWGPGTEEEVFDVAELERRFSLDGINRKSAVFDSDKLFWLNGQHLSRAQAQRLAPLVAQSMVRQGLGSAGLFEERRDWFLALIDLLKPRARTVHDFGRRAQPFFDGQIEYDVEAVRKHWREPAEVAERLQALRDRLAVQPEWLEQQLERALRGLAEELGVSASKLIHPLRLALTGEAVSPGIFEVLAVMGRSLTLRRLDDAIAVLGGEADKR